MALETATETERCTFLKPLPGFNIDEFPYMIARTGSTVDLINAKTGKIFTLVESELKQIYPFPTSTVINLENGQFKFYYVETSGENESELKSCCFNKSLILEKFGYGKIV